MIKQVVVRTYPNGWTSQTTKLQELLSEGYRVVFATELPKGIIEYIVEKEVRGGESTMPKRYRDFCSRVIDSERLTPTVILNFNSQEDFINKINELILQGKDQGFSTKGISDKWHTFGDLYYHRMILTYIILKNYPSLSWKSKQHHDGTMFDDSFIVGINTPKGQYSYHYDLEYWDLFDIREIDRAPVYDGHKPEDIDRLLGLV